MREHIEETRWEGQGHETATAVVPRTENPSTGLLCATTEVGTKVIS